MPTEDEIETPYETGEVRPSVPGSDSEAPPSPSERAQRIWARAKATLSGEPKGESLGPTGEKAPRRPKRESASSHRRVSTAECWADVWAYGGSIAGRVGAPFASRAMMLQRDAVGPILDAQTKGTFIDRKLMQPWARNRGALDAIQGALEIPILAEIMGRAAVNGDQAKWEALLPMCRRAVAKWAVQMAPVMARQAREEAEAARVISECAPELLPEGGTFDELVDRLMASIFAFPTQPQTQPDAG
jgi:hypothetical protein